jgi:redox-sensitive bicupin YhaK (pirin superfamily)
MLKKLPKENMGTSNLGWLESRFHFSFAEYRNQNNMNFGVLRVLNDDIVHPQNGFDSHPHSNMEIISYVVDGEITHKDSMGNVETLKRGEVQYLSAGDGIYHSEHNLHESLDLRLLQIWIIPPKAGLSRLYGSKRYKKIQRENKLLNIVSSQNGNADIKIYQDINIYVSELENCKNLDFIINENRQIYFVQVEGSSSLNDIILENGDAMEIVDEKNINIKALENSHFLFIEMPKVQA